MEESKSYLQAITIILTVSTSLVNTLDVATDKPTILPKH